jgi:hypothetical protein
MRARLEAHIKSRTPRAASGILKRQHFRMLATLIRVESLPDDLALFIHKDGANAGIRRDQRHAAGSQLQSLLHELLIGGMRIHA